MPRIRVRYGLGLGLGLELGLVFGFLSTIFNAYVEWRGVRG
jgi:hypothetical protein